MLSFSIELKSDRIWVISMQRSLWFVSTIRSISMNQIEFLAGVEKLVVAITDETGELRPISRIEFELVGHQVRWSLWEGPTRLHTLTDRVEEASGFLGPTKMLLDMRAEDAART
jgi:hypothetical protein